MANSFDTAGNFPNESEFPQSQTVESLPLSVRIGANLLMHLTTTHSFEVGSLKTSAISFVRVNVEVDGA